MAESVLKAVQSKFGDAVLETSSAHTDECVVIKASKLIDVATFLRDDDKMAFDCPILLTCIDWLGLRTDGPRFELVVQLRSTTKGHRIRLKVPLEENNLKVPTLSGIWVGFNWLEREAYDMYGVEFTDHPDLRRIYLYEEFVGFPLRKDYPIERRQPLVRRDWTDE